MLGKYGQPAVTQAKQMLSSETAPFQVMNPNAAGSKCRIVPGDKRYSQRMLLKRLEQLTMGYARTDNNAIHLLLPQQADIAFYLLFLVVRAADDHAVSKLMPVILDRACNLGKKGVGDVGDEQSQGIGFFAGES